MKKKLLLLTVLVMALMCLLAVSASAAASDYFGKVEIIDLDKDGVSDIKVTDKIHSVIYKDNENGVPATEDARVKLSCTCEKGSHTFPAYYICVIDQNFKETLYNLNYSALNALREEYCGSTTDYSITSLVAFEFPNGLKGAYNGLFGKKVAKAIKYVSFAKNTTATTVSDAAGGYNWLEEATSLEEVDFGNTLTKIPSYFCYNCDSLESVNIPDQVTTIGVLAFGSCDTLESIKFTQNSVLNSIEAQAFGGSISLKAFYIPKGITSLGANGSGASPFNGCKSLYFVENPDDTEKPSIYYFPKTVEYIVGEAFKNCTSLNDVLVFHDGITSVSNGWAFCDSNSISVVFLGDMVDVSSTGNSWNSNITIYFCNSADVSTDNYTGNTRAKKVFCNADGNTTHITEKNESTRATCITNQYLKETCFCGKLYKNEEVPDTKTGLHVYKSADCTVAVECSDDEACHEVNPNPKAKHALVYTLEYENGFDKEGVYNKHCTNDYCTLNGTEIIEGVSDPIITARGYSVALEGGLGIDAGFMIDKDLLNEYNTLNGAVTMSLAMVKAETAVNVGAILNGETMNLEMGVSGIAVTVSATSDYSAISIRLRGFDKSSAEGSYYALNLVTALGVKTNDGVVRYIQHGLKNSENTTVQIGGKDYYTITADRLYQLSAE